MPRRTKGKDSKTFAAEAILDERGGAGDDGQYLIKWPENPQTEEWEQEKARNPDVVGRHGGELEEDYLARQADGTKRKRVGGDGSRDDTFSASPALGQRPKEEHLVKHVEGSKRQRVGGDGTLMRNTTSSSPALGQPPKRARIKPSWDYVLENSQTDPKPPADPEKIARQIRREQKKLELAARETDKAAMTKSKTNGKAEKPASNEKVKVSSSSTTSPAITPPNRRQGDSTSESASPSHDRPATVTKKHSKANPLSFSPISRQQGAPGYAAATLNTSSSSTSGERHHDTTGGPSKVQPAIPRSPISAPTSKPRQPPPQEPSLSPVAKTSPIRNVKRTLHLSSPLKGSVPGPVPIPTASQFRRMVGVQRNHAESSSRIRSPSPSQNDSIVHFSSPVQPSKTRPVQTLPVQASFEAEVQVGEADQGDGKDSGGSSSDEEPEVNIVSVIVDGEEVLVPEVGFREVRPSVTADFGVQHQETAGPNGDGMSEGDSSEEGEPEYITEVIDGEIVHRAARPVVEDESMDVGQTVSVQATTEMVSIQIQADPRPVAKSIQEDHIQPTLSTSAPASQVEADTPPVPHSKQQSSEEPVTEVIASTSISVVQVQQNAIPPPETRSLDPGQPVPEAFTSAPFLIAPSESIDSLRISLAESEAARLEAQQDRSRLRSIYDDETSFLRAQLKDVTDKAVQEATLNEELETKVRRLRGQLTVGLEQRSTFNAAVEEQKQRQLEQIRMQNAFLLEQARRTDDAVRSKATKYPQMLAERDKKVADADKLLQRNLELWEDRIAMQKRSEELADQLHALRAHQMGVFGEDSDDESEDNAGEDGDSDEDADEMYEDGNGHESASANPRVMDEDQVYSDHGKQTALPPSVHASQEINGDVFTESQLVPTASQFAPASLRPLHPNQSRSQNSEQSDVSPDALFACRWREPEQCKYMFENREDLKEHVASHALAEC